MFKIVLLAGLLMTLAAARLDAAELTVDVGNIASDRGAVVVTVYATEQDFLGDGLVTLKRPARPGRMAFLFKGLTPGDYTASAYHDENGDDEMNTGLFSIPLEPYGFSNDARVRLAPPRYEEAVFTVGADGARVVANLVD
ncbi:MAG: DUF2141 domain-containing protein [Alphaproteobacteria bacterium]